MTVISQPISNFLGGVSQKPYALRAANQVELQENGYSSPTIGLAKRPPLESLGGHISSLSTSVAALAFDRNTSDRGIVVMDGTGLFIMTDMDGNSITVTADCPTTYITVANPDQNLQMVPVGDYIFILNRTTLPAMVSSTTPNPAATGPRTCVWVREGVTNITYTVTLVLGGTTTTATYTPTTATLADTTNIATQLNTAITAAGYTVSQKGSVLLISHGGTAYTPSVSDGFGGQAMVLVDGSTTDPSNLPPHSVDGYVVQITGALSTVWDNYFVQWSDAKAAWVEIPAPGRAYQIDPATMPHVLKLDTGTGIYHLQRLAWNDCPAGDTTTNPQPSFIGNVIQDVFFDHGRLGLLTERTVVMSRANDIFNFWRNTVSIADDADPIDVQVTMVQPAPMRWCVQYAGELFFMTRRGQYEMVLNNQPLTPSTVGFRKVTSYEIDVTTRPVVIGTRMYLPVKNGAYSGLLAFFNTGRMNEEWQKLYDAYPVSQDASQYIVGRITGMAVSIKDSLLLIRTDAGDHRLYCYQYALAEDATLTQSAWHVWPFNSNDTHVGAISIEGTLYLLVQRGDGIWLESMNLEPFATDTGLAYKVLLDRRVDQSKCTLSYSSGTNTTTITLPYSDTTGVLQVVGNSLSTTLKAGEVAQTTQISDSGGKSRLTYLGDLTGEHFYVGRQYNFKVQLSTIVLREATSGGGSQVPAVAGRLQLQRMLINYGQSGYFQTTVTPKLRDPFTKTMTSEQVGVSDIPIGSPHVLSGTFKFPIGTVNINATIVINNDSPLPCRLLNAEWVGQYVSRSKRV